MKSYYRLDVMCTAVEEVEEKNGDFNTHSRMFDEQEKTFKTFAEVVKYLKENYSSVVPTLSYIDDEDGKSRPSGLVYEFENSDGSHAPVEKWNQEDWITIYAIGQKTVNSETLGLVIQDVTA